MQFLGSIRTLPSRALPLATHAGYSFGGSNLSVVISNLARICSSKARAATLLPTRRRAHIERECMDGNGSTASASFNRPPLKICATKKERLVTYKWPTYISSFHVPQHWMARKKNEDVFESANDKLQYTSGGSTM